MLNNKPSLKLLFALLLANTLAACTTYYGAAKIVSIPAGVQVINLDDESVVGTTPMVFILKDSSTRRQTVILRFKQDGFYDKTDSFWLNMRSTSPEEAKKSAKEITVTLEGKGRPS